jgi:uroporphyrinogen decarboxylase
MHAVLPAGWYRHGAELHAILREYPRDLAHEVRVQDERAGGGATFGYQSSRDLASRFPVADDFAYVGARTFQLGLPGQAGLTSDEWSCVWEKLDPGVVGQVVQHPLANWDRLPDYRFPDPLAAWRFDEPALAETVRSARANRKYLVAYAGNVFELMQWLRGYEGLMLDLATDRDRAILLGQRVTEYNLATVDRWVAGDCDAVGFNDDWGTQTALMVRPEVWREVFAPLYRQLFDRVHAAGKDVHFHTDGNTLEIVPDLIALGADVVNLQLSAMDMAATARVMAGRVCLRTDIDRQYILTRASPAEVTAYVRQVCELFGSERGGLILCGEINSDARLANVRAMYEAFDQFGRYG